MELVSVQPEWCLRLPLQQQSVLMLASRGPDGMPKYHPCKPIHVAYRGTVLVAAKYGRLLEYGERADSFMSLETFADDHLWGSAIEKFFANHDELPHHYLKKLMHGAEIVGYKHPDQRFRKRWNGFYVSMVSEMHLSIETEAEMDRRLGDWGRESW